MLARAGEDAPLVRLVQRSCNLLALLCGTIDTPMSGLATSVDCAGSRRNAATRLAHHSPKASRGARAQMAPIALVCVVVDDQMAEPQNRPDYHQTRSGCAAHRPAWLRGALAGALSASTAEQIGSNGGAAPQPPSSASHVLPTTSPSGFKTWKSARPSTPWRVHIQITAGSHQKPR
jgi:hypothetical protein